MRINSNWFVFAALAFVAGNAHAAALAVCVGETDSGPTRANCDTDFFSGATRASSNLATGALKSFSRNEGLLLPNRAGAGFDDEVTVNGLAPEQTESITATLRIRGSFSGESDDDLPSLVASLIAGFPVVSDSQGAAVVDITYDGSNVTLDQSRSDGRYNVFVETLSSSAVDISLAAFVNVRGSDPTFILSSNIATVADARTESTTVIADFESTAVLSLELPPGLTFTSASGVLLTKPVPVPPAVWLFGSGLLGLLAAAARKQPAIGEVLHATVGKLE
ncbi:MAG: hypothetical protein HKO62_09365 [Gammaproteobacteria bacterium]|nr:hypothetical protein [Gammaproteobacteria bacterium]